VQSELADNTLMFVRIAIKLALPSPEPVTTEALWIITTSSNSKRHRAHRTREGASRPRTWPSFPVILLAEWSGLLPSVSWPST